MKKLAAFLFICSVLASCVNSKDQFKLSGSVKGIDTGMVFLQKYNEEGWVTADSAKLNKGEFAFTGKVDFPEMWHVTMFDGQVLVPVFMENAKIDLQIFPDSLDKSVVKGSATHDFYQSYLASIAPINTKQEEAYLEYKKARESGDTLGMEHNDSIITALDGELKNQLTTFAKTNNKTVVSPYLIMRESWQYELPELEEISSVMDTSLNRSQYLAALKKRVEILKSVEVGQMAPDFTMNDTTGKPITLSSLKGKILLVDFWASWCGPCRGENPNVVKAYQAYNKKGFDILGCSFDKSHEKWLAAIAEDHLTWTHVSDLKYWGNSAGKLYGVKSIPANVLLDKDQKIIGRNLRGEDLMKKLEEVLGPATPVKKVGKRK